MSFWGLPGPRAFLEECADRIDDQVHLLIIAPRYVAQDFPWAELGGRVWERSGSGLEIIAAQPACHRPLQHVAAHFDLDEAWTTEQLLAESALPGGILVIDGIERSSLEVEEEWARFFDDVVSETKVRGYVSTRFVGILSPLVAPPASDTHLAILHWWGRLSRSDVESAMRSEANGMLADSIADHLWLECLAKAFALTRPDLVPLLAERAPRTSDEVRTLLAEVLDIASDDRDICIEYDPGLVPAFASPPEHSTPAAREWHNGTLDWTACQGFVWLNDSNAPGGTGPSWMEHALARGQRETLLPVVERVRAAIDRWIVSQFGPDWDHGLAYSIGEHEAEGRVGILGLYNLARELQKAGKPLPRAVLDVLYRWKRIRNDLSHNSSVTYNHLEEAVAFYDRFLRSYAAN